MPEPAIKADDDDEPNPMSVRIMKSVDELPPELRALVYKYDYHRVWFLLPKKKLPSGPGWKVTGAQEDWQHVELCSPYEYDPNAVKPTVKQIEGPSEKVQCEVLWLAFCEWSERRGLSVTLSNNRLSAALHELFPSVVTTRPWQVGDRPRWFSGIKLGSGWNSWTY